MPDKDRLFNERPLVRAALGFCAGIFLQNANLEAWEWILLCLLLLIVIFVVRPARRPLVFLLFLLLGLHRAEIPLVFPQTALMRPILAIREHLAGAADALFPKHAPLVRAMVLGDRATLAQSDYLAFRNAGLAHVLALSGLHIGYFVAAIEILIPQRFLRTRFVLTALFLLFYCALAGFPASLLRASILWLSGALCSLFGKRRDLPSALALAALLILLVVPRQLFEPGFQLSFGAVVGIILLQKPFKRELSGLPEPLAEAASVCISATMATLPIGAYHFGSIQLLSLFSNLLLLPFVPMFLLPALLSLILYPLPLAVLPAFLATAAGDFLQRASTLIAAFPLSTAPFSPNLYFCALYFLALLLLSPYALRSYREKRFTLLFLLASMLICIA